MGFLRGEWDEAEFNIFLMKGPYYHILIMLPYSGLAVPAGHKEERIVVNGR